MLQNCPIIYYICAVLAVVCSGNVLLAQNLPQPQPAQSTSFLSVPSGEVIPAGTSANNATGMNYLETNTTPTANSLLPGEVQPVPATNGRSYQPIPHSGNQGPYPTTGTPTPAAPTPGVNSASSPNPSLPITLEPEKPLYFEEAWTWQCFPDSLLYQSYLAGNKEPRFGTQWIHEKDIGWQWDAILGGRAGLLRYGTVNSPWPEGWQLDIEGAAFVRMNLEHDRDVDGADFRFGVPLTVRQGPWQGKFGYYHLSSHLGDEYMVRNQTFDRINYVRDCLLLGVGFFLSPDLRLYSEADYAFNIEGGAEPWKFQFGLEYSPAEPTQYWAKPFFAINGLISQENDYSGNVTVQTGLQWRGRSGHLARIGMQYFNGMSEMAQFYRTHEEQIGMGMWYDF
jgi:hypothetical protein